MVGEVDYSRLPWFLDLSWLGWGCCMLGRAILASSQLRHHLYFKDLNKEILGVFDDHRHHLALASDIIA